MTHYALTGKTREALILRLAIQLFGQENPLRDWLKYPNSRQAEIQQRYLRRAKVFLVIIEEAYGITQEGTDK